MTTQVLAKRRLTVHDYKYFVISASCFLCFLLALMPVKILSLKKISLLALELKQRQRICSAESQRSVLNIFSILIGGQTPDKRNGKHQKDVWFVLGKKVYSLTFAKHKENKSSALCFLLFAANGRIKSKCYMSGMAAHVSRKQIIKMHNSSIPF